MVVAQEQEEEKEKEKEKEEKKEKNTITLSTLCSLCHPSMTRAIRSDTLTAAASAVCFHFRSTLGHSTASQ